MQGNFVSVAADGSRIVTTSLGAVTQIESINAYTNRIRERLILGPEALGLAVPAGAEALAAARRALHARCVAHYNAAHEAGLLAHLLPLPAGWARPEGAPPLPPLHPVGGEGPPPAQDSLVPPLAALPSDPARSEQGEGEPQQTRLAARRRRDPLAHVAGMKEAQEPAAPARAANEDIVASMFAADDPDESE